MNELNSPPSRVEFMRTLGDKPTNSSEWTTWLNNIYRYVKDMSSDPYFDILIGNKNGYEVIKKFGRNAAVGTSFVPIAIGGIYQRKQPASATTLRIKAGGDANDTAAGTGARSIFLEGLDETGTLVQEELATAGASASSATTATFIRLFRAWVEDCGSYGGGSHVASITIEDSAGAADWATIDATDTPEGQSEIGIYTVPKGYKAYVTNIYPTLEASKTVDLRFFKREGALTASAPYSARRSQISWSGLETTPGQISPKTGYGPFPEYTDFGFIAKIATGTAHVAVNYEIILVAI